MRHTPVGKVNGKSPSKVNGQKKPHAREPMDGRSSPVSQSDVPAHGPDEALRIAQAVADHGGSASPMDVAAAIQLSPNSGLFKMLCGASIAYGYTEGGYNAKQIVLQSIGQRIVQCTEEGDDVVAKREGLLRPRVLREFLNKYDGKALPKDESILQNVLGHMGVPTAARERTVKLILNGAQGVGFIQEIKGSRYINLNGVKQPEAPLNGGVAEEQDDNQVGLSNQMVNTLLTPKSSSPASPVNGSPTVKTETRKVFITHGKNRDFINPLKELLSFGNWEPVVAAERESVSLPVPEKVMKDMRACSAAIIHVDAELKVIDNEANPHVMLNPNVMVEIGAAMALYGNRFILLVREGVKLPSNLQGLYEVRYQGDKLDTETTIKLLKAINDIKNHPLPTFG